MLRIPCPWCGLRDEVEFHYGGQAHIARPSEPEALSDEEWADYLYMRDNPKGVLAERWVHAAGCRRWSRSASRRNGRRAGGSRRRDAPELLASSQMASFVTHLRATYDVIVIDTAPLAAGVDALTLAALAGNLLMVLRLGKTDRVMAEAKLEILRRLPLRLLGAVLNDVRDGSEYSAYAYYMDGYALTNEPLFRPLAAVKKPARPPTPG